MKHIFILFLGFSLLFACKNEEHFISDSNYRKEVENDFSEVETKLSKSDTNFFSVLNKPISLKEKEALKFLFAYMPLSDIADYSGEFFLKQVRTAFSAKEQMTWGQNVPEDIFRHFVLPPRVNNENLDTSRMVFFNELKARLNGLSIEQAALEVNHWCHEKVIYQPTGERTISPLGIVKSAFGRCGEESTFTVAAMRSVSIPARQCYTPRWAHCDDNHAWVEVWIDGKWKYLGACEPKPKLNVAWFDEPVLRTMLVHTKAFGKYKGDELVDKQHNRFAYMNLINTYAPNKAIVIKVTDSKNTAVKDATVEFQLYNYAEFFPLSRQKTDTEGYCSFTTGYGDLLIWVYKDNLFSYKKISVKNTDTLQINLPSNYDNNDFYTDYFVPPIARKSKIIITEEEEAQNKVLLDKEDSIRNVFIESFYSKEQSHSLAKNIGLQEDRVWNLIKKSRGNWQNIVDYINQTGTINKDMCLAQLELIDEKDLRDTKSDVFVSNLKLSAEMKNNYPTEFFNKYILNPRISYELLTKTKVFFKDFLPQNNINSPTELSEWISENISTENKWNYYRVPISPKGIYKLGFADEFSKNIFFVQGCRAMQVPARLEPETKIPQYYSKNKWVDAPMISKSEVQERKKGFLELKVDDTIKTELLYRIHFSIAKFDMGRFNTLDFGWDNPLSKIEQPILLDTGRYILLTGNRQADGSVFTKHTFFNIHKDKTTPIVINFYSGSNNKLNKISFNDELNFINLKNKDISFNTYEQNVFIWLDTQSEPSKHLLNDLSTAKAKIDKTKLNFYFIFEKQTPNVSNELKGYDLPKNSNILFDTTSQLKKLKDAANNSGSNMPFVFYVDKNYIKYFTSGYNLGVPEQIIKQHDR